MPKLNNVLMDSSCPVLRMLNCDLCIICGSMLPVLTPKTSTQQLPPYNTAAKKLASQEIEIGTYQLSVIAAH